MRVSRSLAEAMASSLRPRAKWTPEDDELLRRHVAKAQQSGVIDWKEAANATCRTTKQCRERWLNVLDPSINREPWTPEELDILFAQQKLQGNKWASIAEALPGRPETAVKNTYYAAVRRRERAEKKAARKAAKAAAKAAAAAAKAASRAAKSGSRRGSGGSTASRKRSSAKLSSPSTSPVAPEEAVQPVSPPAVHCSTTSSPSSSVTGSEAGACKRRRAVPLAKLAIPSTDGWTFPPETFYSLSTNDRSLDTPIPAPPASATLSATSPRAFVRAGTLTAAPVMKPVHVARPTVAKAMVKPAAAPRPLPGMSAKDLDLIASVPLAVPTFTNPVVVIPTAWDDVDTLGSVCDDASEAASPRSDDDDDVLSLHDLDALVDFTVTDMEELLGPLSAAVAAQ